MTTFSPKNTHVAGVIHRHGKEPLPFTRHPDGLPSADGPGSIVGATYGKTMQPGSPSAQWALTLKVHPRFDLREEVRGGDWVVWWWVINGRSYHATFGPIVGISDATESHGGANVVEYTIVGADFARIMERTQVWFDDFSEYETNAGGKFIGARMGFTPTGSPDNVIENVISAFLGKDGILGGVWTMPKSMGWIGDNFVDGLHIYSQSSSLISPPRLVSDPSSRNRTILPGGASAVVPSEQILRGEVSGPELVMFQPQAGTVLAQHLQGFCNDLLNDLFYDVLTDDETLLLGRTPVSTPEEPYPCVFARERPFPNKFDGLGSPWWKLPTIYLRRDEGLVSKDTQTSTDERINLFLLYASNVGFTQLDQYALYPPSYDREDIARHGICKFERETVFSGVGQTGEGRSWAAELTQWHGLLTSWYGLNHAWLSGSMAFSGIQPRARIGRRLVLDNESPEKREQYYIEGVNHQWRYPHGGSTTLSVTRGWRGSDEALASAVSAKANTFQRESRGGNDAGINPQPFNPDERLA